MTRRDSLLAVLVAVIWGCNFVAIGVGLTDVPPFLFLALRFFLVAFPLVFFVARPKTSVWVVIGVGFFMSFGQFGLLYLAMAIGMPAGLAALVLQAQVLFTILIAWAALGERASQQQLVGTVIGSTGLIVVGWGFGANAALVPLLVTIGAAFSWAIGNVIARGARVESGLSLVVWSALVVPLPCLAVSLLIDGPAQMAEAVSHFGPEVWLSTTYTVVLSSLVGYTLFNGLMAKYPAAKVVPYILLVPPVGIFSAWWAFGELPTPVEWIGAAVMMAGVAVATISFRAKSAPNAPSDSIAPPSSPN